MPSASRLLGPLASPREFPRNARLWTTRGGRCAVASTLGGLSEEQILSATTIAQLPHSAPGLFLSCLEGEYAFKGAQFNVAILLNAHRPGRQPAPLWGTTPVPGHSGIVEMNPAPHSPTDQYAPTPLFARRVGDAWLVVRATLGFARNPSLAQSIQVLDAVHITRIDINHA